jgi:C-terminal processing protease CtpA/Prc
LAGGGRSAGVLAVHDRIMRIHGKVLKGETDKSIDAMLREATQPTILTVVRDIRTFEISIQAREYNVTNLKTGLLPSQIG